MSDSFKQTKTKAWALISQPNKFLIPLTCLILTIQCTERKTNSPIWYPTVPEEQAYAVVQTAIQRTKIKKRNLDLHAATFSFFVDANRYVIPKWPKNSRGSKHHVLTEEDLRFIYFQERKEAGFVWDNYQLKFKQQRNAEYFHDISYPVFDIHFRFALVAIELQKKNGLSHATIFLMEQNKNKWIVRDELVLPYRAHFDTFKMRGCHCDCPRPGVLYDY